jgi:hypothetical protein
MNSQTVEIVVDEETKEEHFIEYWEIYLQETEGISRGGSASVGGWRKRSCSVFVRPSRTDFSVFRCKLSHIVKILLPSIRV